MEAEPLVDRDHLRQVAYPDSRRLGDRAALYRYARTAGALVPWVLSHADWPAGARVLDAGCGPGAYLADLAGQADVRAVGVDLSEGMCREARDHTPTTVADVAALPFPDGAFDRVLAPHMLYHCPDIAAAVAELRRVVAPGGTLLAVVNASDHLAELRALVWSVTGQEWPRIADRITVESGPAMLAAAFDRVTVDRYDVELHIPDPAPVLAYLRSTSGWSGDVDPAAAEAAVERRIAAAVAESGTFRATVRSGVLVCH